MLCTPLACRLAAAGGDWKRPPSTAPSAAIDAFRRAAASVLDTLDARRPWFIKEPRLCLVARELLPLLTRPVFVHVVRDPFEVADSLAARDRLDRTQALALWETYTRAAFAASRGWPRVLVDYADLVADPIGTSVRLHASLAGFGVAGLSVPDEATITGWIEPALHRQHNRSARTDVLTDTQRELLAAIGDGRILDPDFAVEITAMPDFAHTEAASSRAGG